MSKITLPIRFDGLRTKVIVSLVIACSCIALFGVYRITRMYAYTLEQQLQERAKTLSDAVIYIASSSNSASELQRFVVATAHSPHVHRIVVATRGTDPAVADSARVAKLSQPPRDVVTTNLIQEWGELRLDRHCYDWFAPTMISSMHDGHVQAVPGVVHIQLETAAVESQLRWACLRVGVMFTTIVAVMAIVAYRLLYRWVLVPAADVSRVLERRAAGDNNVYAMVHSRDELGRVASALNSLLETLDHKEAERRAALDSLLASESLAKKLSMVASRTDNGVIITDRHGHVEWVNEGFTRISGYTLEDMQGRRPGEILQGCETSRSTIQFMRERLAAGEAFSAEVINYRKEGTPYWVSIDVQPVYGDEGQLTQFVAIQRDITSRKEAQAEQQKFVSLVENSSDFIAMATLDGQFTYVNPAGCRLVGLTGLAQAIRSKLTDFMNTESANYLTSQVISTALATGYWTGELIFRRFVANDRLNMQTTVFLIRDAQSGQPICLAVVGRDVTERKRAEVTLLRSHQEIAAARMMLEHQTKALQMQNEELRLAHEKAEAAVKAKGAFLANMSHEIRTPMTAILGFADMLLASVKDPDAIDSLRTIHRNGEHLLAIINDILDISKIEADRMEVEQLVVDPLEVLDEVIVLLRGRAQAKGLELRRYIHTPVPNRIVTDPTRLRQILLNLIGNAIKFTEAGTVEVRAGLLGAGDDGPRQLYFDIIDTGIGLTEQQMSMLFQPFVQADNSMTRRFGGTGLGLSISQRFAEMLGGAIKVTSQPGQGSTFRVTIAANDAPETPATSPGAATEEPVVVAAPTASAGLAGCHLLLAEDGADNQRILSFFVRKAGATVDVVENGQLAVEAVQSDKPFDAILLDMQMPVMDGYEAAHLIRQSGFRGPIIALTAHAMRGDREKCLAAGCDDYMTKPVDRAKLMDILQQYCTPQHAAV